MEKTLGNVLTQFKDSLNVTLNQSLDSVFSVENKEAAAILLSELSTTLKERLREILDDPVGTKANMIVSILLSKLSSKETIEGLNTLAD